MIDRLAHRVGARVVPTFSWGSILNTVVAIISMLATLGAVIGGYYVLNYRVSLLEVTKMRSDTDHDSIQKIQNDVGWIKAIVEKRSKLGAPFPFDPTSLADQKVPLGGG